MKRTFLPLRRREFMAVVGGAAAYRSFSASAQAPQMNRGSMSDRRMLCGKNIAVRDIWFGVVEISPF